MKVASTKIANPEWESLQNKCNEGARIRKREADEKKALLYPEATKLVESCRRNNYSDNRY